jgi:hypothetical protein
VQHRALQGVTRHRGNHIPIRFVIEDLRCASRRGIKEWWNDGMMEKEWR